MLLLIREAAKTANRGWGPTLRLVVIVGAVAASATVMAEAGLLILR
jgi:hypothetical protein